MASASLGPGTFAEFLAWEQGQDRRHEYIDHVAVMMAGGTRAHDRIQRNLLIRATSDSTRKTDLLIKFRDYDATPSIRHYVLIARTEYLVFVYFRADSGNFSLRPKELRQPGESVDLPDLGLSLTLAEIYEGIGLTAGAA